LGRPADMVAAMVVGVVIRDARAVVAALADPETLYVFGVIAARTSKLGLGCRLGRGRRLM